MSYSFAVELARSLIRQNTINPPGNEASCAEILAPLLSAAGFTVELVPFAPGRVNLLARIGDCGPGGRALAFTGHLDTVPLGARPWSVDPMGADIDGDRLYGRGSSDMKAGVAAFVAACIDHAEDLSRDSGALLVLTAAEETGCEGARTLVHQGIGGAGALIVAEPTSNYPLVGHKGALWLQAVAQGVTAHGSMPEKGINAVTKAAKAVVQLDDFDFNENVTLNSVRPVSMSAPSKVG